MATYNVMSEGTALNIAPISLKEARAIVKRMPSYYNAAIVKHAEGEKLAGFWYYQGQRVRREENRQHGWTLCSWVDYCGSVLAPTRELEYR